MAQVSNLKTKGKKDEYTQHYLMMDGVAGALIEAAVAAAVVVAATSSTVVAGIPFPLAELGRTIESVIPPVILVGLAIRRGKVTVVPAISRGAG